MSVYVIRLEYEVNPGRLQDQEARMGPLVDGLQGQPGFRGTALLNSLGYPARYIRFNAWESREAARESNKSQASRDFFQKYPTNGIITPTAPATAWEEVLSVVEPGRSAYALLVDWTVDPGKAEAFEQSRKELFDLRRKNARGIVRSRLTRFLGSPNRYAGYSGWLSEDDARAFLNSAESQEWNQQHPISAYASTPPTLQRFEVVKVVVPATV